MDIIGSSAIACHPELSGSSCGVATSLEVSFGAAGTGPVSFTSKVLRLGGRLGTAYVEARDKKNRLEAHGHVTKYGTLRVRRGGGGFEVRAARDSDAEAVADVWQAGYFDQGGVEHIDPSFLADSRTPAYFAERAPLLVRSADVACSTETGQVVGFAAVRHSPEPEIEQLFVAEGARGTGAAAELLAAAERRLLQGSGGGGKGKEPARAMGIVLPGNTRARVFYEKHGWEDEGSIKFTLPCVSKDKNTRGGRKGVVIDVQRYGKVLG